MISACVALVLGVAAVIAGGADDSPGLQGIGLLLVVTSLILVVRARRNGRRSRSDGS